jgi:hypothetical protein
MKRVVIGLMCLLLVSASVLPAVAQGRRDRYYRGGSNGRTYEAPRSYGYGGYRNRRSWWDQHRDKATVGIGTGVGAAIGAMAGGGRGAVIGALVGAGGSALYTYGIRDRNRRNYGYYGRTTRRGYYRGYR